MNNILGWKAVRALRFIWRHFFMLLVCCALIPTFMKGSLNWRNVFFMIAIIAFFDWVKRYIKFTPHHHSHNASRHTSIQPFRDQWWDSSLRGTPAHFLNNMDNSRRH